MLPPVCPSCTVQIITSHNQASCGYIEDTTMTNPATISAASCCNQKEVLSSHVLDKVKQFLTIARRNNNERHPRTIHNSLGNAAAVPGSALTFWKPLIGACVSPSPGPCERQRELPPPTHPPPDGRVSEGACRIAADTLAYAPYLRLRLQGAGRSAEKSLVASTGDAAGPDNASRVTDHSWKRQWRRRGGGHMGIGARG